MKLKSLLVLLMATALLGTSCSNNEKNDELISESDNTQQDQVLEDADFIVDADESDLLLEEDMSSEDEALLEEELSDVQPEEEMGQEDLFAEDEMMMAEQESGQMVESQSMQPMIDESAPVKEYTVQEGDTLLWIAFKLYGDYGKWKELSNMNGGVKRIDEGQVLSYEAPAEPFEWSPQGLPHLIKRGETLGTISEDKYGTDQRWRDIYENNQPMIKDPNLIFAGFTLYYVPDNRGVASE